jgi:hypothetical protein
MDKPDMQAWARESVALLVERAYICVATECWLTALLMKAQRS